MNVIEKQKKRLMKNSNGNNRVKRNKYGIPVRPKGKTVLKWIDRNRSLIEIGIIVSLFLTGSTTLGCVM